MDPAEPGLDTLTNFFFNLNNTLDKIATLSPPWKRVSAVGELKEILLSNATLLSPPVLSELCEKLEWNRQAAVPNSSIDFHQPNHHFVTFLLFCQSPPSLRGPSRRFKGPQNLNQLTNRVISIVSLSRLYIIFPLSLI